MPSDHPTDEGIVSLLADDFTRNDAEVEAIEALTDLAIASLV